MSDIDCWVDEVDGDEELMISITNAYPSIWYICEFNIENNGTVPAHFAGFALPTDLPETVDLEIVDMSGEPFDFVGLQLHPGKAVYGMVRVHINNPHA